MSTISHPGALENATEADVKNLLRGQRPISLINPINLATFEGGEVVDEPAATTPPDQIRDGESSRFKN